MARRRSNRLRIIGGQWRGRLVRFPSREGLRPTPDRVRETVFNWLQGVIEGARCLDLFAGSGALGLEALSRGAQEAVLVEADRDVAAGLCEEVQLLGAHAAQVVQADVAVFLRGAARPFDVVFLDPPYHRGWLPLCCALLESRGWLAAGAHVYLEAERDLAVLPVPAGWEMVRSRHAGHVAYHLAIAR